MSDDYPSETVSKDDGRLLELLDRLGTETGPAERGVLEALGALPLELEELAPRPEVRKRLIRSVRASPAAVARRPSRWQLPIAAGLALVLLGIAALQLRKLDGQERTIAELSSQLRQVELEGAELEAATRRLLAEKNERVRMLTTRGTEFCLLRPVGEPPRYPGATATMVIAADRRAWFLAAEGLEPCAAGVCYQLWFITEGESIHAASFDAAAAGERLELSGGGGEGVPAGVRAISITRDPEPEAAEPSEPVLFADQAMTLL